MNLKDLSPLSKLAKEWDADATRLDIAAKNEGYGKLERVAYRATALKIHEMTKQLRTIMEK